ncbi:hypothetical protein R1sor_009635 [Riccia sorocarpa]|uniref:Uncharacterized protein n=1 Tax=Riccia sorocarpa TaxID=122646 RepID=A0ABD3HXP1_9MARC
MEDTKEDDVSLVHPNGIPSKVALRIRSNTQEFMSDFNNGYRVKHSSKLNIRATTLISIVLNTISKIWKHVARREIYRMRVRMDVRLLEFVDPDEYERFKKSAKRPVPS